MTIELYGLRTAVHLRMRAHAALRQARHRELGHRRRRDRIHAALDAVDDRRRLLAGLLGRGVAVPADGHTLQTVRSARLDDVSLPPRAMDPHRKPGRSRSQTTASLLSTRRASTLRLEISKPLLFGMAPSRRFCSVSNMRRKYVINLHTTVLEPGLVQADSCLRRKRFLVAMREIMIAISVHYCTTAYLTALVIYATNFTRSALRPDFRSTRSGPKSVARATVGARIVRSARVGARRGRAPGRDPKGGVFRPTPCVKPLTRCTTHIALRGFPALSA